jgi:hypothetical protein
MPVNITDVDTFTDPIVGPADSDPADRTYVMTIAQGLANRTRSLLGQIGSLGTFAGADLVSRTVRVGAHRARIQRIPSIDANWIPAALESGLQCTSTTDGGGGGRRTLWFDVSAGVELPWQCTLSQVQLQVRPGAARGSASDQMQVSVYRVEANPEVMAQLGTTTLAANNGNLQLLTVSFTTISINGEAVSGNNHRILVHVQTGVESSAVNDTVYDARFTLPTIQVLR